MSDKQTLPDAADMCDKLPSDYDKVMDFFTQHILDAHSRGLRCALIVTSWGLGMNARCAVIAELSRKGYVVWTSNRSYMEDNLWIAW
jgi:hypothetical protein